MDIEQKLKELSVKDAEKIVLNVKAKIFSEKNINAEKFYVYTDSLTLRSNWELEIQDWNLDQ